MVRSRVVALVTALIVGALLLPAPPSRAEILQPDVISSVTAWPGLLPGEIDFQWTTTGANTDYFELETALSGFSVSDARMPRAGRSPQTFRIPATARSFAMTAAQTATTGAGVGTGNHLYYMLVAVSENGSEVTREVFPQLQAVMPRGLPAPTANTAVRAATFNVRTAKATTDKRRWLKRAPAVALEIMTHRPGVVAVQELSPGRADGKNKSSKGVLRQTTSLLSQLKKHGGSRYDLVRTTSYVKAGVKHGSQGSRILYDSSKYRLRSRCPEKTGKKNYHASCTIKLPLLSNDRESRRRRAAYGAFEDLSTGERFYVVSAHLDQRHSRSLSTELRYNRLRGQQAAAIVRAMAKLNKHNREVIFGGDINSWQTSRVGDAPHDFFVANGYFDTASADVAVNMEYLTSNRFLTVVPPNPYGFGTRIDAIMVQGVRGANWFENVLEPRSTARPSDHNLLYADLVF